MPEKIEITKTSKKILIAIFILCLIGVYFSLELINIHYNVFTDPTFHSGCAISEGFNCETVAASPFSVFLGIPVAAWGAFGYLVMIILTLLSLKSSSKNALLCLSLCSLVATVTSITLALISLCVICSFCLYCSITYVINLLIFILSLWALRKQFTALKAIPFKQVRTAPLAFIKEFRATSGVLIFILLALLKMYPNYWTQTSSNIGPNGVTEAGLHWIGNENAPLVIEEYSDYMCPFCHRGHTYLRNLLENNPDKIKIIHRQFPLDGACNPLLKDRIFHVGACRLARAAICAAEKEKFWEMNDLLYKYGTEQMRAKEIITLASKELDLDYHKILRCVDEQVSSENKVKEDLDSGVALGLNSTPSFVIEGKVYAGTIPTEILEKYGIQEKQTKKENQ